MKCIRSGDRVWIHAGCNNPEELVRAMVGRADELRDVEVTHLLTFGYAEHTSPRYAASFRHRALFTGGNVRSAVNEGRADYVPVFLSEIPRLIERGIQKVDVALIHVSPPDEHGFCSYGVGVECTKAAAEQASPVIALVNRQMPRGLGDSFIHVSRLTHAVEIDRLPVELPSDGPLGEVAQAIGRHVAGLIPDGATLQMGIGEIPDAVLLSIEGRKDLGVHTEMFSDSLISLFERGRHHRPGQDPPPGQDRRLLRPGHQEDLRLRGQQPLRGVPPLGLRQRPLRDRAPRQHGGHQLRPLRGPHRPGLRRLHRPRRLLGLRRAGGLHPRRGPSENGRPIIALPATAKGGTISRIVDVLAPGSGVVTSRADVHYVVTEHGVASLHGRSLRERARELIRIAEPRFRDELEEAARARRLL